MRGLGTPRPWFRRTSAVYSRARPPGTGGCSWARRGLVCAMPGSSGRLASRNGDVEGLHDFAFSGVADPPVLVRVGVVCVRVSPAGTDAGGTGPDEHQQGLRDRQGRSSIGSIPPAIHGRRDRVPPTRDLIQTASVPLKHESGGPNPHDAPKRPGGRARWSNVGAIAPTPRQSARAADRFGALWGLVAARMGGIPFPRPYGGGRPVVVVVVGRSPARSWGFR